MAHSVPTSVFSVVPINALTQGETTQEFRIFIGGFGKFCAMPHVSGYFDFEHNLKIHYK